MKRQIKTEVKAYNIEMLCNKCDGTMLPTGRSFLIFPPTYEHKCNKCNYTESFTEIYPKITFE